MFFFKFNSHFTWKLILWIYFHMISWIGILQKWLRIVSTIKKFPTSNQNLKQEILYTIFKILCWFDLYFCPWFYLCFVSVRFYIWIFLFNTLGHISVTFPPKCPMSSSRFGHECINLEKRGSFRKPNFRYFVEVSPNFFGWNFITFLGGICNFF
jgi:hypothetical protein